LRHHLSVALPLSESVRASGSCYVKSELNSLSVS
jgi:hypothetical protein